MSDFRLTSPDDRSPLAWPIGGCTYAYGHDKNGIPVKQLAASALRALNYIASSKHAKQSGYNHNCACQ